MSPATSLAKPFAKPITQCPYCDHVSLPGSKFCGECGAALHLMPCPQCGAVNDITVNTACYRCHSELREGAAAAVNTLAAPTPPETQIESVSPPQEVVGHVVGNVVGEVVGEVIAEPPAHQRPHALVVGIVLVAFAAASYFAYRQRSVLEVREPALVEAPPPASAATKIDRNADLKTETNAIIGTIVRTPGEDPPIVSSPAASTPPAQKSSRANGAAAVPAELIATKPNAESRRESAAPSTTPPAIPRSNTAKPSPRPELANGLEKRAPAIGPCTEAVAALGLCTPDPSKR